MHLKFFLLSSLCLLPSSQARGPLPQLKLPWGTYQAEYAPFDKQIYVFHDVRFGAKPTRFGSSVSPSWLNDSIQTSLATTDCVHIDPSILKRGPGGRNRLGDPNADTGSGEPDLSSFKLIGTEYCLFLDVSQPLPVNVWFYGGAYAFGTKKLKKYRIGTPLYSGRSLIKASGYKSIFVAGNYRLGAFGWLAGSYMEEHGLPNAGLYDQNLLLQWVQEHIWKVHGDNTSVSSWGESAGAGSILHHLIREDGMEEPLFSRFVTQSPAFEWVWDNSAGGQLDEVYKTFSKLAHCGETYDIDCLRNAPLYDLAKANQGLFNNTNQTGLFPIGPAVDGKWVKTIPTLPVVALLSCVAWRSRETSDMSIN